MSPIRIVTDTGADLTMDVAQQLGVVNIPLVINFGSETYLDRMITMDQFWEMAKTQPPRSSQPPVGVFEEAFKSIVDQGDEVLCITVTSKHSGTYNSAMTAAQRFGGKVTVFDSRSLCWGQRFQVDAALKAASEGKSMEEILDILEDILRRTKVFIVLNTLDYLERGGRAAKFIAVVKKVVTVFNIKPVLTFKEGELTLLGTANSFVRGMLRITREVVAVCPCDRVTVMHTRNPEVAAQFAADLAGRVGMPASEIPIAEAGAAISSHGGPGLVAAMVLVSPR